MNRRAWKVFIASGGTVLLALILATAFSLNFVEKKRDENPPCNRFNCKSPILDNRPEMMGRKTLLPNLNTTCTVTPIDKTYQISSRPDSMRTSTANSAMENLLFLGGSWILGLGIDDRSTIASAYNVAQSRHQAFNFGHANATIATLVLALRSQNLQIGPLKAAVLFLDLGVINRSIGAPHLALQATHLSVARDKNGIITFSPHTPLWIEEFFTRFFSPRQIKQLAKMYSGFYTKFMGGILPLSQRHQARLAEQIKILHEEVTRIYQAPTVIFIQQEIDLPKPLLSYAEDLLGPEIKMFYSDLEEPVLDECKAHPTADYYRQVGYALVRILNAPGAL